MQHAPIFVVGTGRSGTSLLRAILNAHANIYLTFEASFFSFTPHMNAKAYGEGKAWFARYQKSLAYACLRLEPQKIEAFLSKPLEKSSIPDVMTAIMQTKAEQHGRLRFGDKTPTSILYLPELLQVYPEAKIIHVVRDPRAVVASLCRMPWAPSGVLANSLFVRYMLSRVPRNHPAIFEIKLEDFLQAPEQHLRKILSFVGEAWDERVLTHDIYSPVDSPPFPWLASAHKPLRPVRSGVSWQQTMSKAEIRLLETILSSAMRDYGYLLSKPSAIPLGVFLRDVKPLALAVIRSLKMRRILYTSSPPELSDLLDFFHSMNTGVDLDASVKEQVLEWVTAS